MITYIPHILGYGKLGGVKLFKVIRVKKKGELNQHENKANNITGR